MTLVHSRDITVIISYSPQYEYDIYMPVFVLHQFSPVYNSTTTFLGLTSFLRHMVGL